MSDVSGPLPDDGASCPDAAELVELARGSLDGAARGAVLTHVRACRECSEVLRLCTGMEGTGAADTASSIAAAVRRPPGPGDVLANKYRVERVIGIGGMGIVVAARHLHLDRTVALKVMLPQAGDSADTAARFMQEARAAAEVQSEHVAKVLDVGALEDGSLFMVMEFLRGSDFARLVRTHGPLPFMDVAGYVLQACEAIAEAHGLGIVHRDLKPANLFLTTRADGSPLVKVLDFGISKLTRANRRADVSLTKSHTVMGTPVYMSPEQLRSTRSVGPATDIWSIGCIVFELLSGRAAFQAESAEALGALIAAGPTPRVRDLRPEVPSELEDVISRCLEKDPARRFTSVGELARQIGVFAPPDMAQLVGRISRISARPESPLPFANTLASDRPPRFSAGTGRSVVRSNAADPARKPTAKALFIVAGAVAVGASMVAVYRGPGRAPRLASGPAPSLAAVPPSGPPSVGVSSHGLTSELDAGVDAKLPESAPGPSAPPAPPLSARRTAAPNASPSKSGRTPISSPAGSQSTRTDRDSIE